MAVTLNLTVNGLLSSSNPGTHSIVGPSALTNGLLVVALPWRSATVAPTSVTYDGVTMTQSKAQTGNTLAAYIYHLVNPNVGTKTLTTNSASGISHHPYCYFFEGALQDDATVVDQTNSSTNTTANPSLSITPTSDGQAIVDSHTNELTSVPTANSQTLGFKIDEGVWITSTQYLLQGTAGAATFSWTIAAEAWDLSVASFKPAAAAAADIPDLVMAPIGR